MCLPCGTGLLLLRLLPIFSKPHLKQYIQSINHFRMPGHLGIITKAKSTHSLEEGLKRMTYSDHHILEFRSEARAESLGMVKDDREITPGRIELPHVTIFVDGEWYDDTFARLMASRSLAECLDIITESNGHFCAVIKSKIGSEIYLISDHLGLKPLYIYRGQKSIAWSSELKSILTLNLDVTWDQQSMTDYINTGHFIKDTTCYKEIKLIKPGSIIKINPSDLDHKKSTYWHLDRITPNEEMGFEEAVELTREILQNAVNTRLSPEQKNTISLSGGLDSRTLAEVSRSRVNNSFTFGSIDSQDVKLANRSSNCLKIEHRLFNYTKDNWLDNRVMAVWQTDGMMPFYHLHESPMIPELKHLGDTVLNGFAGATIAGGLFLNKTESEQTYIVNHMRRFAYLGPLSVGKHLVPKLPYSDRKLVSHLLSLPKNYRKNSNLLLAVAKASFSLDHKKIPWERTGINIEHTILNRIALRLKIPGVLRRCHMRRSAFPYQQWLWSNARYVDELLGNARLWDLLEGKETDWYKLNRQNNLELQGRLLSLEIWYRLTNDEMMPNESLARF